MYLLIAFIFLFHLKTRAIHRQKFGEFYFRTVVMEYFPTEQRTKTIASMAILLEPSHYNFIDIDSTWGWVAVTDKSYAHNIWVQNFGSFGQNDFVTSGRVSSYIELF